MKRGELGEAVAAKFLKKNGYKILKQNYKIISGEIDIIAYKKGFTAFLEVKTRSSDYAGRPALAVGYEKQRRIKGAAANYILKNKIKGQPRFDVVEVLVDPKTEEVKEIVHLENAFC